MQRFDFCIIFPHIIHINVYTFLPAMLKGLNATFKEVLFLTVQKALHCMYDAIIWLKVCTRNGLISNFGNKWKSGGMRSGEEGGC